MTASVHQTEYMVSMTLSQLVIMISAARVMNTAFRRLGQPGVIGEIVAGLLLGPSLFGHFFPEQFQRLFDPAASSGITIISQIGLIFLMFQIGMDFEFGYLKTQRNRIGVLTVAMASVAVPFALGLLIGERSAPALAPKIDPLIYSLFFGVALSITAVPVLGRILRGFGLAQTEIGVVAISAAAINDVTGWIILAAISAYTVNRFSLGDAALQLGGFAFLMIALRVFMRRFIYLLIKRRELQEGPLTPNLVAIAICLMFAVALCTSRLGIFAPFGGFAAGLLFHEHATFVDAWRRQVGTFVLVFFLPIFFTFTGLKANVLGLTASTDLTWLAVVLGAAILGKIIPAYAAGRLSGFSHDESWILGSLMNTRGLVELVVLNIGYDLGVIPQKILTMLIIMAVATTVMTAPLLKLLLPRLGQEFQAGIEA